MNDRPANQPATAPGGNEPGRHRADPLFYVGAAALLAAMVIDTLAVIGRHFGHTLIGSIELVQACMLVAASIAMLSATLARKHASVHLLLSRLPDRPAEVLQRTGALLAAVFFLLLAAGSAWIAWELRNGHEESEVLRLPYSPLRVLGVIAMLGVGGVLLRQAFGRSRR